MKIILGFLIFLFTMGLFGMLVFLNREETTLVLTPPFNGVYYTLPEMPLGLLVVSSLLLGFFIGYVLRLFTELLK